MTTYVRLGARADEDSNGTIDSEELRSCLDKLRVQMSEAEADHVHRYCDVDRRRNGIQFPEFVVLLCLMYLLFGPDVTRRVLTTTYSLLCSLLTLWEDDASWFRIHQVSEFESAKLNFVFDELVDAFLFFDRDGDGEMRRKDVTRRMNETSHQERTPGHITARLFSQYSLSISLSCNCMQ
jgi:calcium-binding protein CML